MNQQTILLSESKRLVELEGIIKDGHNAFIKVGEALTEIRDKKLYRLDYPNFETYCEKKWGWSRNHSYRMIAAAPVANYVNKGNLSHSGITSVNLTTAAALSKVPPPRRAGIVQKIIAAGQKVTAAAVSKLAPKRATASTTGFLDATGLEVPPECLPLWQRLPEAQAMLSNISTLRGSLRTAQTESDPLFVEVDFTDCLAKLNQVYVDLQRAKPYAVCPTCAGLESKGCLTCKGRGFVSEFYWRNCVPQETKELTGRK
jgi:hypothetical protein